MIKRLKNSTFKLLGTSLYFNQLFISHFAYYRETVLRRISIQIHNYPLEDKKEVEEVIEEDHFLGPLN